MKVHQARYVNLQDLLPSQTNRRQLTPGEILLSSGEASDKIWFILSGSIRSLAAFPPKNQWRTVQRHGSGELIGWLGWLHKYPIEHFRAAEACELVELELGQFERLWHEQPELRQWCGEQSPVIEGLHLLQQLAHGNPARSLQLDDWRQLQNKWQLLVDHEPLPRPGGHWHWINGQIWPETNSERPCQQRLIWLPDPEDAALQLSLNELGPSRPRRQHLQQLTP